MIVPANFSYSSEATSASGADCASLPVQIEQVQLFEAASGGDPLSPPDAVEPLLLVLAADAGAVVLTITLPAVV